MLVGWSLHLPRNVDVMGDFLFITVDLLGSGHL
jgi:hypothetical protein